MDLNNHIQKTKKTIKLLIIAGIACIVINIISVNLEPDSASFVSLIFLMFHVILSFGFIGCFMAALFVFIKNQSVFKSAQNVDASGIEDVIGDISLENPDCKIYSPVLGAFKVYIGEKGFYIDGPGICLPYDSVKSIGTVPYRYRAINTSPSCKEILSNPEGSEIFRFHIWFQTQSGSRYETFPVTYRDAATILKLITAKTPSAELC